MERVPRDLTLLLHIVLFTLSLLSFFLFISRIYNSAHIKYFYRWWPLNLSQTQIHSNPSPNMKKITRMNRQQIFEYLSVWNISAYQRYLWYYFCQSLVLLVYYSVFQDLLKLDCSIFSCCHNMRPNCWLSRTEPVNKPSVLHVNFILSHLILVFRYPEHPFGLSHLALPNTSISIFFSLAYFVQFFIQSFHLKLFILSKNELVLIISMFHLSGAFTYRIFNYLR